MPFTNRHILDPILRDTLRRAPKTASGSELVREGTFSLRCWIEMDDVAVFVFNCPERVGEMGDFRKRVLQVWDNLRPLDT